jgi:hypothetical protein
MTDQGSCSNMQLVLKETDHSVSERMPQNQKVYR